MEITTSYLYGKHGIEIRIWSLRKDNSQSWVRISHGSNKFVIVSNYNDTEILADPQEDQKSQTSVKVIAARSKAKAKPQRTEPVDLPSIIPMNERKWIDIEPSEPCEYKQYCHVGNTAKQCRMGLFQDSDFAGDLEDSKSTSGGTLCIFGSHTFVPISWMCKKQAAVSHSSTESEIISLDTGLRLDGLPALELWDLIVSVLGNVSRVSDGSGKPESDVHKHHKPHKKIDVMKDIDAVPSNVQSARQEALLYVFEDNESVIKMIMKGRSPTMRHVSRTHRVALDWLFDRINLDS